MGKKTLSIVFLTLLATTLGMAFWALPKLPDLERNILEQLANRASRQYFDDSLRIHKATLDRHFKLHIERITGRLKTRQGSVPLEIRSLDSQDPLFLFIIQKPVRFIFEGIRPQGSSRDGISGTSVIQSGPTSRFEFIADFSKTALDDWQWLDSQNLGGATGAIKGNLTFRQVSGRGPEFIMDLEAPSPGGSIQARFFDLFLPYLPASLQKERVQKITQTQKLIHYDRAALKIGLPQSDHMKILLQIFIPDYNLRLTLNVAIKADQKDAFSQIARIMGLIEVK